MNEEQQIKKGFNAGYLIAKHRPELSKQMQNGFVDKENPYSVGFIAGAKEYGREVSKPRTKNYDVGRLNRKPKSQEKEKNKDRDYLDK